MPRWQRSTPQLAAGDRHHGFPDGKDHAHDQLVRYLHPGCGGLSRAHRRGAAGPRGEFDSGRPAIQDDCGGALQIHVGRRDIRDLRRWPAVRWEGDEEGAKPCPRRILLQGAGVSAGIRAWQALRGACTPMPRGASRSMRSTASATRRLRAIPISSRSARCGRSGPEFSRASQNFGSSEFWLLRISAGAFPQRP